MTTSALTEVLRQTRSIFEATGEPLTTTEVADRLDLGRRSTYERLERLVEHEQLETKKVGANGRIWWRPSEMRPDDYAGRRTVERQLRALREAVERATDPIYFTDKRGTIEYVNPAFEETTGYTAEEAIGERSDRLRTETNELTETERSNGASSNEIRRGKHTTMTGDVVEEIIIPVRDTDGEIERFVGILLEETERANDEEEYKREHQREHLAALSRMNTIFREIIEAVINQSTRKEIEQTVCEALANVGSYEFAWIGEVKVGSQTVRQRAEAGVSGYLDDVVVSVDPTDERSNGDTGRALRTGTIQTTQDIRTDPRADPWRENIEKYDYRSTVAIPIIHDGTTYGVLRIYAKPTMAFEGPEKTVLSQLGKVIGHAIAAAERKQALMSDEVVTVEFHIPDMLDSWGVETTMNGYISFENVISVSENTYLVYGTMDPDARETLEAMVDQYPPWDSMRVLSEKADEIRFELNSSESSIRSKMASEGGSINSAVLEDGNLHLRIQLPPTVDVNSITKIVTEEYPAARFLSKRQFSRTRDRMDRAHSVFNADLTEKQRAALEAAYYRGYFEWPRETSGETIAELLGIAPPTFSYHLRHAERTLFEAILSSTPLKSGDEHGIEATET